MLERTLFNFVLEHNIWSVEKVNSYTAKEKIFYCIQRECKEKFNITSFPADYYYRKDFYEQYLYN